MGLWLGGLRMSSHHVEFEVPASIPKSGGGECLCSWANACTHKYRHNPRMNMQTCMYECLYVCMYVYMYVYMYACMYVCWYIGILVVCSFVCVVLCSLFLFVCIRLSVCVCAVCSPYLYACAYATVYCICSCICADIGRLGLLAKFQKSGEKTLALKLSFGCGVIGWKPTDAAGAGKIRYEHLYLLSCPVHCL